MALTQISQAGAKDEAINEAKIQISNAGTNGQFLQKQSGNTGGLTWADVPAGVGGGNGADFNDNVKIRLGTGNDLELYHDGSWNYIRANNGNIAIQGKTNENSIVCIPDGKTSLYYDNSEKFKTYSGGVEVTGLKVLDNNKLKIGNAEDLQIYHDGSNSYITEASGSTPGDLRIQANNLKLANWDGGGTYVYASNGGSVDLYYDNSKKFETVSAGAQCIGQLIATTSFRGNDNVKLDLGTSQDLQIYHNGSHSYIWNTTGDLQLRSNSLNMFSVSGEQYFQGTSNGATELYYDNSKKFETTSNGAGLLSNSAVFKLGGSSPVEMFHNGVNFHLRNPVGTFHIQGDSNENSIRCLQNGASELYYDGTKKLETHSTGITVRGSDAGDQLKIIPEGTNAYGVIDFESPGSGGGKLRVQGTERFRLDSSGRVFMSRSGTIGDLNSNDPTLHVTAPTDGGQGGIYVHCNSQSGGTAAPHYGIKIDAINCANNANLQAGLLIDVNQQYTQSGTGVLSDVQGNYSTTKCFDAKLNKALGAYTNGYSYYSEITTSSSGGTAYHMYFNDTDGSNALRCYANGNIQNKNNSYGSTSDVKLKENIVDAGSQWEDIKAVKVRNFNFKADPDTKMLGVVAQEIETVSAGLVVTDNDIEVNEETGVGKVVGTTKSVKYSILYMKAIKALQEAMAKIETLETKVAALEAK